jgi:DNA-binding transcriptional regulator YbjK
MKGNILACQEYFFTFASYYYLKDSIKGLLFKYTKAMTKKELAKIKENLPKRYLEELSQRTGKAKSTCSKVLNGHLNSELIISEAIKLAQETKAKNEAIRKRIASL